MNYLDRDIQSKVEAAIASDDYDYILQYLDGLIIELSEMRNTLLKLKTTRRGF